MNVILVIVGAILGSLLLGSLIGGAITGALFGLLASYLLKLREQIDELERQIVGMKDNLRRIHKTLDETVREPLIKEKVTEQPPPKPETARAAAKTIPPVAKTVSKKPEEPKPEAVKPVIPPPKPIPPEPTLPPAQKVPPGEAEHKKPEPEPKPKPKPSPPATPKPKAGPKPKLTPKPKPAPKPLVSPTPPKLPEPSVLTELLRRWVLGGNPLVKIGVLILFLGLAFALRYAAEHGLLPLWLRYAGVAATGIGLIAFGWRWRGREDNYGLVLQGGGIAVLYLTTLAAMKLHPLLPLSVGFVLLFLIAAFAAFSAVVEDSMLLAIVAALGGFAAPVLASTGAGNHIILFSYLTVLNLGIVAIAWFKRWRVLNILGYVCSFGLGSAWAAEHYRDELFWTTEPFLLLLFGLYVLITVLFARRTIADAGDSDAASLGEQFQQTSRQVKYVDGSLAFGVPFSAFWVQHLLVEPYQYGTAISAVGFSVFYFALALLLTKGAGKRYALLNETLIALGAVFGTLAIPLLETPWTAAAWAVEAAGVYWIGYRQRQLHVRLFAFVVLLGSAVYFLPELRWSAGGSVLDGPILSAVLLTVSTGFTYWLMWRAKADRLYEFENNLRPILVVFGAAMLATIPLLLFAREGASPAFAILGTALLYLSGRLADRPVLGAGWIYLLAAAVLFLTTLGIPDSGTVLSGPTLSAVLLTANSVFIYWLIRRAEPQSLYDLAGEMRPVVVSFGAVTLATVPLLLLTREWAGPVFAILGTALLYLSGRLADRSVLSAGWVYQLVAAVLFATTLGISDSGTVLSGPTLSAILLTANSGFIYWMIRHAEPQHLYDLAGEMRPVVVIFGAAMLATIPLLLLAREWAGPAIAILGTALIYLSARLADRTVFGAGWTYQLAGGALFLTAIEASGSGTVLADGFLGLLGTCLVGVAMLAGVAIVRPNLLAGRADDNSELAVPVNVTLLVGLAFINLAPLFVLSWRLSAMIWPVIGIGTLVWAVRTRHRGVILFSLLLQLIAGFFHMRTRLTGDVVPALTDEAMAFINSGFLGPLIIALAGLVCARLVHRGTREKDMDTDLGWIAIAWGGLWWAFAWTTEVIRVVPGPSVTAALIAVTLATAWAWSMLSRRLDWSELGQAAIVYLPVLVVLGAHDVMGDSGHPAAGWGALAWPAALVMHGFLLRRQKELQQIGYAHTVGVWLFVVLASLEIRWWLLQWSMPETAWPLLASILVPTVYIAAISRQKVLGLWPVREFFKPYVMTAAYPLIIFIVAWFWFTNATNNGNAAPMPYLPVLNPLELGYLAILASVLAWWRLVRAREKLYNTDIVINPALGATAFAGVTGGVIRACHHWANVAWNREALFASDTVQASMSIVWGTLAISLMLFGNRRQIRTVWFVGAGLIAVVVLKLFVIELSAVGTLQRIVSFIGVGFLLLLVGYVAPLPPRVEKDTHATA